jgi:hypothetical protein
MRVIQWTTGNIGSRSLHAIIGRPDMELVGVFAHGADKVGKDAAELAGWPEPTGVTATNDIDALIAQKPDACCYTLDRLTFDVTFTAADGDSDLGFMQIPKGTVAGVYGYHRGWVGDRNIVSVGFNWTMGDHVTPPKPLEHGHVIQVFGLPNMRTVLHCLPPKDWTEPGFMGLGMIYTAMPVTNAVPAVVAAAPGIVTLKDLPPITGCPGL